MESGIIDWSQVTLANILYTIAAVCTMITSALSWLQSRKNTKIGETNSVKLSVAAEKTDLVAARVNGHLDDLKTKLSDATAENSILRETLARMTREIK